MELKLTPEQEKEFLEDKYINIVGTEHRIYAELDRDDYFWYFELINSKNGRTQKAFAHDVSEMELLNAHRPYIGLNHEPKCPNCSTEMIYQFQFCPKCGQKLDWSEE